MRLLIFTQYFYPENFKGNDIAFDFAQKGYDVHVVTAIPNYPTGRFYEGYSFFKRTSEKYNGVKITRLPVISRGSGKGFRLLINYVSYLLVSCVYSLLLIRRRKYDIIFVQQLSPVTIALPAILYKYFKKVPLVMWVLDLWPESVRSASNIKSKMVDRYLNKLVVFIYRNCDKILISSNGFKNSIMSKGNFSNKIHYFPNWSEDIFLSGNIGKNEMVKNLFSQIPQGGFKIMYTGNLGEAQNFEHIMKAIVALKDTDIQWIFVGNGRKIEFIRKTVEKENLQKNVFILGNHPVSLMPYFFEQADVMLLSLKNEPIFRVTVPAKVQSYMSFGKPIFGIISGEAAAILKEAKCGFVSEPDNLQELISLLLECKNLTAVQLNQMGKNAKEYYHINFAKEKNYIFLETLLIEKTRV
jgi:glycosyltransferase involved in cell wall biosynthesis